MKRSGLLDRLVPVLFEDDSLLAVTKPAGIDVGGDEHAAPTDLIRMLQAAGRGKQSLHPANRLSRYESGVLLLCKNDEALRRFRTAHRMQKLSQQFVVVVRGRPARPTITIEPTHGTSRGRRHETKKRPGRTVADSRRTKTKGGASEVVEPSKTTVKLVSSGEKLSMVRCMTKIPTTHALRAQLRAVKLNALGDRPLSPQQPAREGKETTCLHLAELKTLHPETKERLTLRAKTPAAFTDVVAGKSDVSRRLAAALLRRLSLIESGQTDAYRLLSGDVEDFKGLTVERYGDVVVLFVTSGSTSLVALLPGVANWYARVQGTKAVYLKRFPRDRSSLSEEDSARHYARRPFSGTGVPETVKVLERGLSYLIKPYDGFAVGFYPDQRDNRNRVRKLASGKDVLNLFAYTCSLSVAAAAGGAKSTVSVDLSQKSLDWGRENFAANFLGTEGHDFVASDVAGYLKRARRDDRTFDIAIVDPPSFAHGRKRGQSFSLTRDLPSLLHGVVDRLRADGILLLTTNHRRTSVSRLREFLKEGAGRRRFRVLEAPSLPADYAVDSDHAKTIIVQFA